MSWKNAHHDRGPPATAQAMVEADEIVIGTYLVVADPGLVVAGEDAVVVGPAEVTIEPEVVLISRAAPRQTTGNGAQIRCFKRVATAAPLTQ